MDQNSMFGAALGLQEPWFVKGIRFSLEDRRLDIDIDFRKGGLFPCPQCKQPRKAYDTADKSWRHLNFFQYECHLNARVPRIECGGDDGCGILQVGVPWGRTQSGFTLLFESLIMAMVKEMPVASVAALVGETDHRLWRVLHHYVNEARKEIDMSDVTSVGIDETSRRKGHNYISCFVDLNKSKLLFVTEGKGKDTVAQFQKDLIAHKGQPEQIKNVCCDLSPSFISGVTTSFPKADLTFDRFHVMKIINDAVDAVRREESKQMPELKKTRYLWLKNEGNLTVKQKEKFDSVKNLRCKTAKAYQLKITFQEFFAQTDKAAAEVFLHQWYSWAVHCQLDPMVDAAKTVKSHWQGIMNWYDSHISNGVMEGINSLIQAAKARARGYRSVANISAMAFLIAGKFNFKLPT